jgi:hypothetical protein
MGALIRFVRKMEETLPLNYTREFYFNKNQINPALRKYENLVSVAKK